MLRSLTLCIIFSYFSCQEDSLIVPQPLFSLQQNIGIDFSNNLVYTEDFNPYLYRNFYNGGGVSCGDINNDGLIDIYFTGNQVDNKLYLNKGDWTFQDITETAGVACADLWCTGVNMVDINADGLLDIYVCKGGDPKGPRRYNELFINNGDLTFTESSAEYGLDIKGLSIQSAFVDYDRDGDLDCYLLNNSIKPIGGGLDLKKSSRDNPSEDGNKFLRNDGGKFIDVTNEVGIYNSDIGFGLGITISDFNLDEWPDIYISNDFFEKDYLYINQQDGTYLESAESFMDCMSMGAMGADAADLNNDLAPDLMVTEMLPRTLARKKTKAIYENWKKYKLSVKQGYYHQFPRNTLQVNNNGKSFYEVGRRAGVDATDWSWSCMMQDFDNDGWKDIFITNGIYKDLLDRDYLKFIADKTAVASLVRGGENNVITKLIDGMPSSPKPNHMFTHKGDLIFTDSANEWGLASEGYSNGCAYADLDNDGDLDIVVNNVNASADIYKNSANEKGHHFLDVELKGSQSNTSAIGSKILAYRNESKFHSELYPSKGFQSSVSHRIHFGLGENSGNIDSLIILWPDGKKEMYLNLKVDSLYTFSYGGGKKKPSLLYSKVGLASKLDTLLELEKTRIFNQFDREKLLYRMNPQRSPIIEKIPDRKNLFVIGGSKNQNSQIVSYDPKGLVQVQTLEGSKGTEVNDIAFIDVDGDGDLDIYLACGGTAHSPYSPDLHDKIYENSSGSYFLSSLQINYPLSISTSSVVIQDVDKDGYDDILIADSKNHVPYGGKGSVYHFRNREGKGFGLIPQVALNDLGMISTLASIDLQKDGTPELVVAGEWMKVLVFSPSDNIFTDVSAQYEFTGSTGMWSSLDIHDVDGDGRQDIFLGNCGNNTSISAGHSLVIADFDNNRKIDAIVCEELDGKLYPLLDKDDMTAVFPQINKKYLRYDSYAQASLSELMGDIQMESVDKLSLESTESQLYINSENGFTKVELPYEIQYSSIFTSSLADMDDNGQAELILGGNHFRVKPQFGREEASHMWRIDLENLNTDKKLEAESLNIKGEVRSIEKVEKGFIFSNTNGQVIRCGIE